MMEKRRTSTKLRSLHSKRRELLLRLRFAKDTKLGFRLLVMGQLRALQIQVDQCFGAGQAMRAKVRQGLVASSIFAF